MKTSHPQSTGGPTGSWGTLTILASLLLAALPLAAANPPTITGTGYLVGVPVPGILCTNAAGQVSLKGNVHVLMVQADDARMTGRFQAGMDLAYQADGTALFGGAAQQEVGTWNLADPANPKFTPTGGVWDMIYRGVAQADGSDVITLTGYGVGGVIEGLRLEETITKGPGVPLDPPVPYQGTGTIKGPPENTQVVLDDFGDGQVTSQWVPWSTGTVQLIEEHGQFTVQGAWNRPATEYVDHAGGYWVEPWSVAEGQTMEWRAEVLGMNADASDVGWGVGTGGTRFYQLGLGRTRVALNKWTAATGYVPLLTDSVSVKLTNVVLSFALTRRQSDAVVTIRVLDRADQDTVLYEKRVMDQAPYLEGDNAALAVAPRVDLANSVATVTFDNFERRTYEVPTVAIERAVRLTWPAPTGMNYAVEGGPTVQGPWLPVKEVATPGLQQMTAPADDAMKFFRLRQAP